MDDISRKDIHNSDIPIVCRACEARHKGVCGALSTEQLVKLAKQTKKHAHNSDEELIAGGENITRYSNVMGGVIKLTKLMADGRQQIVGLQFAPDFLGSPFRHESDVTAEAATDVQLCSFPASLLSDMMKETPALEHMLHAQSQKELSEARDWMLTLGRKTAPEKVASFLYLIATHIDPTIDPHGKQVKFELPLKRADIADFLGITIETVSRQITKLRKAGTIEVHNNRTVIVPDMDRLKDVCEIEK